MVLDIIPLTMIRLLIQLMNIYTKYKCKVCSEWWTEEQRNKADIDNIEEEIGLCKLHKYIDEQGVGI